MTLTHGESTKYMNLTHIHLDPIVEQVAIGQEYVLMDMYRQELGRRFEQVTTFKEEREILKQYFKGRFTAITDDVFRIITYPENYRFNFEKNQHVLVEQFLSKLNKKDSNIKPIYQPKSYGYQTFANKYINNTQTTDMYYRIQNTSLELYRQKFKDYILNEVNQDRERQAIYITYAIDLEKYPEKSAFATIDDPKELLNSDDLEALKAKLIELTVLMKGKTCFYYVESFVSFYLSEIARIKLKSKNNFNILSRFDDIIEYPSNEEMESPETFIGNLYDIIYKMPRGTKINNVETILRQDLIWRFRKYKAYLNDKYPNKPSLSNIEIGFHGTREDRISSIVEMGLMIPNSKNGLNDFTCGARYGTGIYLSPDPRFSMHYCRGDSCLLVCAVLPGRKYICNSNLWSNGTQPGYDSHISEDKTELVLFEEAQVLPCVIIHFTVTDNYLDWWTFAQNGNQEKKKSKAGSYREQMEGMNKKEKKAFLASFGESHLSYGFGPLKGRRNTEFVNVSFPDEQDDETQTSAVWYGEMDSEHHNMFQMQRYSNTGMYPIKHS